ncbi:MAG: aminopeptidase P family protein [Anaerolineae bacterium]|nr:aminopeptidase P family protein [Anaerolineae bacterium]
MLLNQARARECMDAAGLDALIACTPVNITAFSDFTLWLDPLFREYMVNPGAGGGRMQRYALFPREGPPALVVEPMMAVNAADLWVQDLITFGAPTIEERDPPVQPQAWPRIRQAQADSVWSATPNDALLNLLREHVLEEGRLGIEMEELPQRHLQALRDALPRAQLLDCSNLLRYVRAVKTADEIERLRRAAQISEAAAMTSLAQAAPGVSLAQLSLAYRAQVAQAGADFDHFAIGIDGVGIATETGHHLAAGAVMYVDFGCRWRSCYSDSGLTLALGPLSPGLQRRYDALRACIDAGVGQLRPGRRGSQAHAAMQDVIDGSDIRVAAPHGHGLGLEVRDYPVIVANNGLRLRDDCLDLPADLPLEVDMVVNLEASSFLAGEASLHIEETFLITVDGAEPLSPRREAPLRPDQA